MSHLGVNSQVALQIHLLHCLPPDSTSFPLGRGQRSRVFPHCEPKVLERLNKANHHERRFVVCELTRERVRLEGNETSVGERSYTLEYWRECFAHLLA